jgi:hypothetical protein
MFDIDDSRLSKHWYIDRRSDGYISFAHPLFQRRFFSDDLGEGDASAKEDFELVISLLEEEFKREESDRQRT